MSADRAAALRSLPSVDQLLRRLADHEEVRGLTRARLTALVREALEQERTRVLEERAAPAAAETLAARVVERARQAGPFSLRPVINAQGVVLHTNLGRALMSPWPSSGSGQSPRPTRISSSTSLERNVAPGTATWRRCCSG